MLGDKSRGNLSYGRSLLFCCLHGIRVDALGYRAPSLLGEHARLLRRYIPNAGQGFALHPRRPPRSLGSVRKDIGHGARGANAHAEAANLAVPFRVINLTRSQSIDNALRDPL